MFVPAAQPTDLPIAEAGARRNRVPKTQKLGFELHKSLRSSLITPFSATVKLLRRCNDSEIGEQDWKSALTCFSSAQSA
jgi:hypothetical protein